MVWASTEKTARSAKLKKQATVGGGADAPVEAALQVVEDEAVEEEPVAGAHRSGREVWKVACRQKLRLELGGEKVGAREDVDHGDRPLGARPHLQVEIEDRPASPQDGVIGDDQDHVVAIISAISGAVAAVEGGDIVPEALLPVHARLSPILF
jgi:hypothetical protein